MVSETAMEEIARLAADGIQLTPREIIRLNALGLALKGERASVALALPRVAFLGDVVFREPSLGHEIWLEDVRRYANMSDVDTSLAIHAFCLSHIDCDNLPKLGRIRLYAAMIGFRRKMRIYTPRQIAAALRWVTEGNDARSGEYPPPRKDGEPMDESFSVPIGILIDGIAIASGTSVGDARHMTSAQLFRLEDNALKMRGCDIVEDRRKTAEGDFYATLDEIEARARERAKAASGDLNNG